MPKRIHKIISFNENNLDIGSGVGMSVSAIGNTKIFQVIVPEK